MNLIIEDFSFFPDFLVYSCLVFVKRGFLVIFFFFSTTISAVQVNESMESVVRVSLIFLMFLFLFSCMKQRFTKNVFFVEKNPTIVNFPVK